MIENCPEIIDGVFNLIDIQYFSDTNSIYSNITFTSGSVYFF